MLDLKKIALIGTKSATDLEELMEQPEWLSIVEYARQFNVSDMTVRRRIRTGRLRAELRDGKYYIPSYPNNKSLNRTAADIHYKGASVATSRYSVG